MNKRPGLLLLLVVSIVFVVKAPAQDDEIYFKEGPSVNSASLPTAGFGSALLLCRAPLYFSVRNNASGERGVAVIDRVGNPKPAGNFGENLAKGKCAFVERALGPENFNVADQTFITFPDVRIRSAFGQQYFNNNQGYSVNTYIKMWAEPVDIFSDPSNSNQVFCFYVVEESLNPGKYIFLREVTTHGIIHTFSVMRVTGHPPGMVERKPVVREKKPETLKSPKKP